MDLLYLNDKQGDLTQYYDEATFQAFDAVIDRPLANEADKLEETLEAHMDDCIRMLRDSNTYVFLAGQEKVADTFDKAMSEAFGSESEWQEIKRDLLNRDRWAELLYH